MIFIKFMSPVYPEIKKCFETEEEAFQYLWDKWVKWDKMTDSLRNRLRLGSTEYDRDTSKLFNDFNEREDYFYDFCSKKIENFIDSIQVLQIDWQTISHNAKLSNIFKKLM